MHGRRCPLMAIEVPDVLKAAGEVEARLNKPHPPVEKHSDWDSIALRLDDTMRTRLLDLAKQVV